MKLHIDIDGRQGDADFSQSEGAVVLELNGVKYEARVDESEPGLYVALLDGRVYRCELHSLQGGRAEITVNGQRVLTHVRDLKHLGSGVTALPSGSGRVEMIAPMPGKVVRILRGAGEVVKAGEGVLIVEAMKMQNEMQSPRDGKVIEIRFEVGQTVNAGELLGVIE